jgi:hypothetical protein
MAMPLPAPPTPRRRLIRSILLWLLLAFTLAGAALLAHSRTGRWQAALQEPATFGPIEVRLPKGWQVTTRNRNGSMKITAREPGGRNVLTITSDASFDPTEFFTRSEEIALSMGEHELARHDEEVDVPGGKGIIIHLIDAHDNPIASMAQVRFASGQTLTVDSRNTGQRTPADEALLFYVTQSLRVHAGAPAQPPANTDGVDI